MTATGNPFTFGSMIRDPDHFIGRRAELAQITDRLNGSQPQGSSVVGPRRIGKSSLLYYLAHPCPDDPLGAGSDKMVVYFSAADGGCATPDAFRASLLLAILRQSTGRQGTPHNSVLDDTLQLLEAGAECTWESARTALEQLPCHPVVCLDEFEALMDAAFDDRFFNGLRNWANEGKVTWVTASARPLSELRLHHHLTSPFFNLLATIALGDLTEREADELLDQASSTAHPFSVRERKLLRALAGSNPYHLQIVASQLWDGKAAGHAPDRGALSRFLCQQPNPPATCRPQPRVARWVWLVALLLLLIILLAGLLEWRDPNFVHAALADAGKLLQTTWSYLGALGDGAGGVIIVLALIAAVLLAVKRRSLTVFWQELRRKLLP